MGNLKRSCCSDHPSDLIVYQSWYICIFVCLCIRVIMYLYIWSGVQDLELGHHIAPLTSSPNDQENFNFNSKDRSILKLAKSKQIFWVNSGFLCSLYHLWLLLVAATLAKSAFPTNAVLLARIINNPTDEQWTQPRPSFLTFDLCWNLWTLNILIWIFVYFLDFWIFIFLYFYILY